jgi:hypothetical protein
MRSAKSRPGAELCLFVALWLAPLSGGCGHGVPDAPAVINSAAANADDPDVFRPAKPRASPAPPPPSSGSNKDGSAQNEAAKADLDVYVPENRPTRPAVQPKKGEPAEAASVSHTSEGPALAVSQPPTPPKKHDLDRIDPDIYVPEKPSSPPKTPVNGVADKASAGSALVSEGANPADLKARVQLYQSDKTDAQTRLALEKEFIAASREGLRAFLGLNFQQPAAAPPDADWLYCVGGQLWDSPFIAFLDLQNQALTTLSERPTAVALAALVPNNAMRADLRRTLSRHWHEGPKAMLPSSEAECPLAEPGFITVLKSIIRENRGRASPQLHPARPLKANVDADRGAGGLSNRSFDADWNRLLEELVRSYCRASQLASLARSAAAFRNGAGASPEKRKTVSPMAPLPGCEIIASHSIDWPGEYIARLPHMAGNDLTLDYQRIEKRMKPGKPLTHYRRQIKSCIERPMPDGVWLDGFIELKGENRLRSVDVMITCTANRTLKSVADEQELTVEILTIEVQRSSD